MTWTSTLPTRPAHSRPKRVRMTSSVPRSQWVLLALLWRSCRRVVNEKHRQLNPRPPRALPRRHVSAPRASLRTIACRHYRSRSRKKRMVSHLPVASLREPNRRQMHHAPRSHHPRPHERRSRPALRRMHQTLLSSTTNCPTLLCHPPQPARWSQCLRSASISLMLSLVSFLRLRPEVSRRYQSQKHPSRPLRICPVLSRPRSRSHVGLRRRHRSPGRLLRALLWIARLKIAMSLRLRRPLARGPPSPPPTLSVEVANSPSSRAQNRVCHAPLSGLSPMRSRFVSCVTIRQPSSVRSASRAPQLHRQSSNLDGRASAVGVRRSAIYLTSCSTSRQSSRACARMRSAAAALRQPSQLSIGHTRRPHSRSHEGPPRRRSSLLRQARPPGRAPQVEARRS